MDAGQAFVKEYVVVLGLLGGLFIAAGVNPETAVMAAFDPIIPGMALLASVIGATTTLCGFYRAHEEGGVLGLLAVGCAFTGGWLLDSSFGVLVVVIALVFGFCAPYANIGLGDVIDAFR